GQERQAWHGRRGAPERRGVDAQHPDLPGAAPAAQVRHRGGGAQAMRGILAALLIAPGGAAAAAQPRARARIAPKGEVLVGEQLRLDVTVLVPNYFLSAPQFPTFDIADAVVTLIDENALNTSETIGGDTFAGIRRSYAITPQRGGDFVLPPAEIT